MTDIDRDALALALEDIAGWLENDSGHKHARIIRLAITALRSAPELKAENARLREALQSILDPFPATYGPAEDMLEDWISAVGRFRATARAALKPQEPEQ